MLYIEQNHQAFVQVSLRIFRYSSTDSAMHMNMRFPLHFRQMQGSDMVPLWTRDLNPAESGD